MVNQDTDIVALMDIATLVHDTEYKTKQSFGESDPQRLKTIGIARIRKESQHLRIKKCRSSNRIAKSQRIRDYENNITINILKSFEPFRGGGEYLNQNPLIISGNEETKIILIHYCFHSKVYPEYTLLFLDNLKNS
jgi:hypothetical protein